MAVVSLLIRVGGALVFVVVAAVGCSSLASENVETTITCNFGNNFSSQAECSTTAVDAFCNTGEWRSSDHSCTGKACLSKTVGEGPFVIRLYCGNGSPIPSADAADSAWTLATRQRRVNRTDYVSA